MRDDFLTAVKEVLAKRVGYKCANPDCRQPTSGPQEDSAKAVNIGVAAHITAASPDGPRFDAALTPEQRRSAENGIWLCQNHGKLVDNDALRYSVVLLNEWKRISEEMARRELEAPRSSVSRDDSAFRKLEKLAPRLLDEMASDLVDKPAAREFVTIWRKLVYNFRSPLHAYYYEDHEDLDHKLQVMENLGLVRDAAINDVKRYRMSEELADYLLSRSAPALAWQWDDKVGVWLDTTTGHRYCAKCKADGKSSPLKTEDHGYRCNVCGQYTNDPTRPRSESKYNPPPRGPHGWMAN